MPRDTSKSFYVDRFGDEVHVELYYPNAPDALCKYVFVNQQSLRASDGVRLHYDYERDGFVIEQASVFRWDIDDTECDPGWREVAFIKSWAIDDEGYTNVTG